MNRRGFHPGGTLGVLTGIVVGLAGIAVGAACDPPTGENCHPPCAPTFQCTENNRCLPKTLDELDLKTPGRGLAGSSSGDSAYLSAVHPRERLVVVARDGGELPVHVLGKIGEGAPEVTAIDGNAESETAAAVWPGDGGAYRLNVRKSGRWFASRPITAARDYPVGRHFDVAVDSSGGVHVLFRNVQAGALQHLAPSSDDSWSLATVDDGTTVESRADCAPGGADSKRPGVGYEPDVEFLTSGLAGRLAVSYYDGDCGDLRLAQRSEGGWSVQVVDTGRFSIRGESTRRAGNVGRFSSIAARPNGELAIAYQDARRGRLAFASETNGAFGTTLVDPGLKLDAFSQKRKQLVGAFSDLGFDSNGRPYIAYLNGSSAQLRFAYRAKDRRGNRRWFHRAVGDGAPTGFRAQLVVRESRVGLFAERLVAKEGAYRSRLFRSAVDLP